MLEDEKREFIPFIQNGLTSRLNIAPFFLFQKYSVNFLQLCTEVLRSMLNKIGKHFQMVSTIQTVSVPSGCRQPKVWVIWQGIFQTLYHLMSMRWPILQVKSTSICGHIFFFEIARSLQTSCNSCQQTKNALNRAVWFFFFKNVVKFA